MKEIVKTMAEEYAVTIVKLEGFWNVVLTNDEDSIVFEDTKFDTALNKAFNYVKPNYPRD